MSAGDEPQPRFVHAALRAVERMTNRGGRRVGGVPRYERVKAPDRRMPLPRPTPERSAVPPDEWQSLALSIAVPNGAARAEFVYVPEGCVTTFRCDCCGGRREWLSDFRDTGTVNIEGRGRAIMDTLWPAFVQEHASCRPALVEEPTLLSALVETDAIVEEAGRRLLRGQPLPSRLVAFTSAGRRELVLPVLPPRSDNDGADHRRAVAELHYGIRAMCRREGIRVDGIVMAQLAYLSPHPDVVRGTITPREAPDRTEILLVTVLTPDAAHAAIAPLRRSAEEKVSMDRLTWQAVRGPSLLLDGMIASEPPPLDR